MVQRGCFAISLAKNLPNDRAAIGYSKKSHWKWQDRMPKENCHRRFLRRDILANGFKGKIRLFNCIYPPYVRRIGKVEMKIMYDYET